MPRYDTISFLTDYGTKDEFVGVVKSVMRNIAPHAAVIDVTHDIEPFDVRAASLALVRSAQYLCPGVVLAVVDPGVGSDRKAIAVEVGNGESVLVGPDNGLLAPVVALVGGAGRVVELTNTDLQLVAPGATFAGRDVFGPAAAHLANGLDLAELGPLIDPATLQPGLLPFSAEKGGVLEADVIWIDRYGNAQLNVTPEQLEAHGDRVVVKAGTHSLTARKAHSFSELGDHEVGLVIDSAGLYAIVVNQGSAAARLGLAEQDSVTLHRSL